MLNHCAKRVKCSGVEHENNVRTEIEIIVD